MENKPRSLEDTLLDQFKTIFGLKKVVFDTPGESQEQDCLFIEIEKSWNTFKDGRAISKVTGNAVLYGPNDQLTIGFFSKAIARAPGSMTKNLFFYDFEENTKRIRNIVQRSFSFIYFFDSQYDPVTGKIESVNFITEDNP